MLSKSSELFHTALVSQYKELIHEALLESNHVDYLDEVLFNEKFKSILVSAKHEGLTSEDLMLLMDEARREILDHRKVG